MAEPAPIVSIKLEKLDDGYEDNDSADVDAMLEGNSTKRIKVENGSQSVVAPVKVKVENVSQRTSAPIRVNVENAGQSSTATAAVNNAPQGVVYGPWEGINYEYFQGYRPLRIIGIADLPNFSKNFFIIECEGLEKPIYFPMYLSDRHCPRLICDYLEKLGKREIPWYYVSPRKRPIVTDHTGYY